MQVVSRKSWGARAPRGRQTVPWSQRVGVAVHHSAGPTSQSVAAIQSYHMDVNKWSDVGYNLLVDQQGRVYEGRGWDVLGAHATGHNAGWIGVCWIGDATKVEPSPAAKRAVRWCVEEAQRRAGRKLQVRGHGQLPGQATECPGPAWRKWITAGMPVEDDMPAKKVADELLGRRLDKVDPDSGTSPSMTVSSFVRWTHKHTVDIKQTTREMAATLAALTAKVDGGDVAAAVRKELERHRSELVAELTEGLAASLADELTEVPPAVVEAAVERVLARVRLAVQ